MASSDSMDALEVEISARLTPFTTTEFPLPLRKALNEHVRLSALCEALQSALTAYTADYHKWFCREKRGGGKYAPLPISGKGSRLKAAYDKILFLGMPSRGTFSKFPLRFSGALDTVFCAVFPRHIELTDFGFAFHVTDMHHNFTKIQADLPAAHNLFDGHVTDFYQPLVGDVSTDLKTLCLFACKAQNALKTLAAAVHTLSGVREARLTKVTRQLCAAIDLGIKAATQEKEGEETISLVVDHP
jgi:hypothetical protein